MISVFLSFLCLFPVQSQGERRPLSIEVPAEPKGVADVELRFYDVAGQIGQGRFAERLAKATATVERLGARAAEEEFVALEYARQQVDSAVEGLLEAVRERMEPPFEGDVARVTHLADGKLAFLGRPEQHRWLSEFLAGTVAFRGLVDLQTRLYILPAGEVAPLGEIQNGQIIDAAETARLMGELDSTKADRIEAPRVIAFPFQAAELMAVDQVAYIKDYELKVLLEDGVEIADPIIDVAQSGFVMKVRSVPLANGEVGVHVDLEHSTLALPIPTFETSLGSLGQTVTIQLPEITKVRVDGHFEVRADQTLVLVSPEREEERRVVALLQVSLVDEHER